jgi:hypothetical protein
MRHIQHISEYDVAISNVHQRVEQAKASESIELYSIGKNQTTKILR